MIDYLIIFTTIAILLMFCAAKPTPAGSDVPPPQLKHGAPTAPPPLLAPRRNSKDFAVGKPLPNTPLADVPRGHNDNTLVDIESIGSERQKELTKEKKKKYLKTKKRLSKEPVENSEE